MASAGEGRLRAPSSDGHVRGRRQRMASGTTGTGPRPRRGTRRIAREGARRRTPASGTRTPLPPATVSYPAYRAEVRDSGAFCHSAPERMSTCALPAASVPVDDDRGGGATGTHRCHADREGHVGGQTSQGQRDQLIVLAGRAHDEHDDPSTSSTMRRQPSRVRAGICSRARIASGRPEAPRSTTPTHALASDAAQDERARTVGGNATPRRISPGTLGLHADAERAIDSPADAHRRGRGRPPHPSEAVHRRAERRLSGQECNRRPAALRVHPIGAAPGNQGGLHGRDCRVGGVGDRRSGSSPRTTTRSPPRRGPHPTRVSRGVGWRYRNRLHIQHVTGQRDASTCDTSATWVRVRVSSQARCRTRTLCLLGVTAFSSTRATPSTTSSPWEGTVVPAGIAFAVHRLEGLTGPFDEAREQVGGQASRRDTSVGRRPGPRPLSSGSRDWRARTRP